uniref:Uncharacterized protein n=1 Tax=Setaria viridis TaxID=4556 RepID=A0A4U6WES9_SETVI|nr:hypothetical protein SEVIR_1G307000v2 [Setaria viridis]
MRIRVANAQIEERVKAPARSRCRSSNSRSISTRYSQSRPTQSSSDCSRADHDHCKGGQLEPIQEEEVEQSQSNDHHPDNKDRRPDNHHCDNRRRDRRGDRERCGRPDRQPDRDNLHDLRDLRGELNNRHQERDEVDLRRRAQYDRDSAL